MNAAQPRIAEPCHLSPQEFRSVSIPGIKRPDLATLAALTDDPFVGLTWFATVSHPGKALEAAKRLEEQGYRSYLPMCCRERRNREIGRKEVIKQPLFDRYGFVGIDIGQPFGPIGNTRGVAFVVRRGDGRPCVVPVSALRHVKARCDADGGVLNLVNFASQPRVSQAPAWAEGQALRVLTGPFAEFVGLFAGAAGDHARVLVELFGRQITATVGVESLEAVG